MTAYLIAIPDHAARAQGIAEGGDGLSMVVPADVELTPLAPPVNKTLINTDPMPLGPYCNSPAIASEYAAPSPQNSQVISPDPYEISRDGVWRRWYVDVEAMLLTRDNSARNARIIWPNLSTQSPVFDSVGAPDITFGYYIAPKDEVQLVYFNALDMEGDAIGEASPFSLTKIRYESNLQNVEVNYLHTWNVWSTLGGWSQFSLLGGFRYLHLDEQFGVHFAAFDSLDPMFVFHENINLSTANDLYGAQVGIRTHKDWKWIFLDTSLKWGVYGNAAVQHQVVTEQGIVMHRRDNHPSVVSDIGETEISIGH
ncbi:MAG TPA: hypothetical protein VGI75_05235, partial [Pirellulales bacterium]